MKIRKTKRQTMLIVTRHNVFQTLYQINFTSVRNLQYKNRKTGKKTLIPGGYNA